MPSKAVRAAMDVAAAGMVDIVALQKSVHREVARLSRNEAAWVTPGAAAALYLATAAAVRSHYARDIEQLEPSDIGRCSVIMPANGHNPYDVAVRQVGVSLISVGADQRSIADAVTSDTVAIIHALVGQSGGMSTLHNCVMVARDAGVPLIVDAAAQIPPVSNLWSLTAAGADAVCFSGGKAMGGPQNTGLLLGTEAFVKSVAAIGFPRHGFGRIFKVGRDQLLGLLTALEELLGRDEVAWLATRETQVRRIIAALSDVPGLEVARGFPNVAGQPVPYVLVRSRCADIGNDFLAKRLYEGNPSIAVGRIPGREDWSDGFIVNTLALQDSEVDVVIAETLKVFMSVR